MSSPAPTDSIVLTERGRQRLRDRLDHVLDQVAELAERIVEDTDSGPEDVEAHRRLVAEVEDLTRTLATAVSVHDVDEDPSIVELGDEVDVEFPDGTTETFVLVHPLEASSDEASISIQSPMSRALLGRRPGERVTVEAPAGVYSCLLLARRRAD